MEFKLNPFIEEARRELVRICSLLFQRGLAHGSAGNISIKSGNHYIATPSGSSFGDLSEDDVSILDNCGNLLSGKKATKEMPFHMAWYEVNPQHNAVVHLHSTFATAVSCLENTDPDNVLPPLTPYQVMKIGRLPLIPYEKPGDQKIAQHIRESATGLKAVLLSNHGPVCGAANINSAVDVLEELESTCRLFLLLDGKKIRYLSKDDVARLTEGAK